MQVQGKTIFCSMLGIGVPIGGVSILAIGALELGLAPLPAAMPRCQTRMLLLLPMVQLACRALPRGTAQGDRSLASLHQAHGRQFVPAERLGNDCVGSGWHSLCLIRPRLLFIWRMGTDGCFLVSRCILFATRKTIPHQVRLADREPCYQQQTPL